MENILSPLMIEDNTSQVWICRSWVCLCTISLWRKLHIKKNTESMNMQNLSKYYLISPKNILNM